jgi:hypothetical protein
MTNRFMRGSAPRRAQPAYLRPGSFKQGPRLLLASAFWCRVRLAIPERGRCIITDAVLVPTFSPFGVAGAAKRNCHSCIASRIAPDGLGKQRSEYHERITQSLFGAGQGYGT